MICIAVLESDGGTSDLNLGEEYCTRYKFRNLFSIFISSSLSQKVCQPFQMECVLMCNFCFYRCDFCMLFLQLNQKFWCSILSNFHLVPSNLFCSIHFCKSSEMNPQISSLSAAIYRTCISSILSFITLSNSSCVSIAVNRS